MDADVLTLQHQCSLVVARNTVGWEEDVWISKHTKTVIREAIADDAWMNLKTQRISLRIGDERTGFGAGQLNYPRGTAVTSNGLLFVADYFNYRVQLFNRDDGSAAGSHSAVTLPLSLSPYASDGVVCCCCYNRTTFDLSQHTFIEHRLRGKWEGNSISAVVLPDGSLLVLTTKVCFVTLRATYTATFERFRRSSNGEWSHQPTAAIQLPQSTDHANSFTFDPETERVWWWWSSGPDNEQQHFIGVWHLTGDQLFQKKTVMGITGLSSHLAGRYLLAVVDDRVCRMRLDGIVIDMHNPGLGKLTSVSAAPDGSILLTTASQAVIH